MNIGVMENYFLLLQATGITLSVAIASLILGLIFAFIFAFLESVSIGWIAGLSTSIVIILRGLPEILVVLTIYNAIPMLLITLADGFSFNLGIIHFTLQYPVENFDVSPAFCGILALSLLYAAYASQTLRGAFKAIAVGQKQAAILLGLSRRRTFLRIILPQIWRHALPGLGNQWLVLLKDTALVSLISVGDIMKQTHNIIAYTHKPFSAYLIAAVIYLIISLVSQYCLRQINQKVNVFETEIPYV